MFENIPSFFTKDQEDEISEGKGDEVVVHSRVETLAAHDHDADEQVADEPAEEDDQVEDGDEDEADSLFHPSVAQDCLDQLYLGGVSHKFYLWGVLHKNF